MLKDEIDKKKWKNIQSKEKKIEEGIKTKGNYLELLWNPTQWVNFETFHPTLA
jgi:muconolactone delta-isomerase